MALGGKTSKKFYVTTGAGADKIDATRKGFLDSANTADAAAGNRQLIDDNTLGPLVVNLQEMQDDIDELRRFVDSASELRGKISPLPIANGGTGLTASQPLIYAKITISSSEMASLNSTRKTLLAAPGANKLIVPVSIVIMCDKLNSTPNSTLTNLFAGYYNGDNRDITRTPTHATLGLLYQQRGAGSYNVNPVATIYQKEVLIVNKEYAMALDVAPGPNGATTSEVLFSYYIADVT